MLCMENEGYYGRVNYPARTNHRIIRLNLEDEAWGFQYSPYAYYNEHAIFLDQQHREMKIEKKRSSDSLKLRSYSLNILWALMQICQLLVVLFYLMIITKQDVIHFQWI